MVYKFKSRADGDVVMVKSAAERVLAVIGKSPGPQGIIIQADMPAAIQALQDAIDQEEREVAQAREQARLEGKTPPSGADVTLRQRAWPLIEMMRRSMAEDTPVVWGV